MKSHLDLYVRSFLHCQSLANYTALCPLFPVTEILPNGDLGETNILYSGPTQETIAVFPVGEYRLWAEIHEEAQAFTEHTIEPREGSREARAGQLNRQS